jgi:drug/metabolite transporter (DMT)-like permease
LALISTFLIFLPELLDDTGHDESEGEGQQNPTLLGDFAGVASGITFAAFVTNARIAAKRRPGSLMNATTVFGHFILMIVGLGISEGIVVSNELNAAFYPVAIVNGLLATMYNASAIFAARYIIGTEVTLLQLTETILAPAWVFLAFGEQPGMWTFIGGSILICTLVVHQILALREQKAEIAAEPQTQPPCIAETIDRAALAGDSICLSDVKQLPRQSV